MIPIAQPTKPVQPRNDKTIPEDTICPLCGAPHQYLYENNSGKAQFQCKVCSQTFITGERVTSPLVLVCSYCGHVLVPKQDRKHFIVHKCVNKQCSYYKSNLKLLPMYLNIKEKYKYKLHYIYREFTLDFFSMDLNQIPSWVTSFKFRKNNAHIM